MNPALIDMQLLIDSKLYFTLSSSGISKIILNFCFPQMTLVTQILANFAVLISGPSSGNLNSGNRSWMMKVNSRLQSS